jgi:hypothetical protein
MKKFVLYFLLLPILFYPQEKSKIIYRNETITINSNNIFEIQSLVSESRAISKSKNTEEYSIHLPFDSFNEISNIKGSTLIVKTNKKKTLNPYSIATIDAEQKNIFKSDNKYKYFVLPDVEDNSIIEYSYKNKLKEPHFLSYFRFQNFIKTESSKLQIIFDSSVEIGYKIFGNHQEKIVFTKTKDGNKDIYTWEAKDIPEFEREEAMPSLLYSTPHIIYYIKSYQKDNKKETLLGTPELLYKWYYSLMKNINKTDETELKNKALELTKDKSTDFEKAKSIFQWVQQNLHYVAFEDGMGGFIPREAADVFQKGYGDCKDMANILNQMLQYVNINSHKAWIGTRLKPYTYAEVPTPQVDNHMITNVVIDGTSYFLDATDKFCPFPYPTAMIQGKEALIGISETEYKIEVVPEVASTKNKIAVSMKLNLDKNDIIGNAVAAISGLNKSELLNLLSVYNQKENEIWKKTIIVNNEKIQLETKELQKNDYQELPSKADFKLKLENAVKDVNGKLLIKPLLILPLKESDIDIEKRKMPIENDFTYFYDITYDYELPLGFKIEFLPENVKVENDLASFEIQYKVVKNTINITQKVTLKKLLLETKDFISWNNFIKNLKKQYNQSIILTK